MVARTHLIGDAIGDGEAAWHWPIVLHQTLLTFMALAEDDEKFWGTAKAHQDFPKSIAAGSTKGLGQAYESCINMYIGPCSVLCISPVSASAQTLCVQSLCQTWTHTGFLDTSTTKHNTTVHFQCAVSWTSTQKMATFGGIASLHFKVLHLMQVIVYIHRYHFVTHNAYL